MNKEHKTYKLETIEDIGNMITVDNIENFLKDFRGVLNMYLLAKLSDPTGQLRFRDFVWIDDNEHKISLNIYESDEDYTKKNSADHGHTRGTGETEEGS